MWEVDRWQHNYRSLSERHQALVPGVPRKSAEARQCVYRNQLFLSAILTSLAEDAEQGLAPPHLAPASAAADQHEARVGAAVAPQDHEKAR